jgi:hypothetical protein
VNEVEFDEPPLNLTAILIGEAGYRQGKADFVRADRYPKIVDPGTCLDNVIDARGVHVTIKPSLGQSP